MRRSIIVATLSGAIVFACTLTIAGTGCYSGTLYDPNEVPQQADKIAFQGSVCTDNPAEREFPLRVVFLVDASTNSNLTGDLLDPTNTAAQSLLSTQRVSAVRDAVSVLRAPDTQFALVRYGGSTLATPDGVFTENTQEIVEAAGALTVPMPCTTDGCRVTGEALSIASAMISGDLLSTARGPRSRTKYVIVLLQSGPTHDLVLSAGTSAECDEACVLGTRVADLREFVLANGGADFQLHAVDIATLHAGTGAADPYLNTTQNELQRMSFAGAGEYRQVCARSELDNSFLDVECGPQRLSLLSLDINSARNVFLTKSFVVTNLNALTTNDGRTIPDSDADGLADEEEGLFGTDPTKRDTDGDGIGDKTELLLQTVGVNPLAFDDPSQCAPIDPALRTTLDTDGDGLIDCEEALLRLDATLFDTDADGIPDPLEVTAGTNFLEDDGLTDSDFDGTPNIVELKAHSDPRSADAKTRNELGYLYRETDLGIRELLFSTQPRDISGVTIEEVSPGTSIGNGTISFVLQAPPRNPILAWRDANETEFGPAVEITEDGFYTLNANCAGVDPCLRSITVSVVTAILPPFSADEIVRIASAQRQCTDFRVRNITLVQTLAADGKVVGANDVRIFFGQVPAQVRNAFGIFRVAQFPFVYLKGDPEDPLDDVKEPNVAEIIVDDFNFVLFE